MLSFVLTLWLVMQQQLNADPWGYHGSLSNGMVIYFAFDDRYVTVGVALAVNVVVVDAVTVVPMVCY